MEPSSLNISVELLYLNILQLGLHSRAVFGCLDGLALHLAQHAADVVELSLWAKHTNTTSLSVQ